MTTLPTATALLDNLRQALSTKFPSEKVDEVLEHYTILKRAARLDQYETCLVNGGKFVEAVLKCLNYLLTGRDVDSVKVDELVRQLENAASLNAFEKTTIPRVLRAIYEFRNKRGGAHNSSFDPMKMDCKLVVEASSWVMEELARLYLTNDPVAAQALVENLLVKDLPVVEEIDGDYVVLGSELAARIQLEFLLYKHYPKRCLLRDLIQWIHNHTADNVRATLRNMKQKNLVHENESGWKLTEAGVLEAEVEILRLYAGTDLKSKAATNRTKGTNHGRQRKRKTTAISY
jgi:hypothetical protein